MNLIDVNSLAKSILELGFRRPANGAMSFTFNSVEDRKEVRGNVRGIYREIKSGVLDYAVGVDLRLKREKEIVGVGKVKEVDCVV